MPKARKPNAGRNPGFLPQQQKSPCPPERLIPTPDAPSFPVNKGGTALKTPFAEPTRQRAFFMSLKAILPLTSAATTLGLSRSPARRPVSCGVRMGGVSESFQKWGISNRFLFPFCSQHGAKLLTQGNFRCKQLQLSGFVRQRH